MMALRNLCILLCLLPALACAQKILQTSDSSEANCVYNVFVRTGTIWKAGTDSIVNLTLFNEDEEGIAISNLEEWGGQMGENWDYFEKGNLDIFTGRGPCMSSFPCKMTLGMDGSGDHPGWYCNYVEVTSTGPHQGCDQKRYDVENWLGPDVIVPQLTVTLDLCPRNASDHVSVS